MINQQTNIGEETKLKLRIMSGYSNIKYLKHKSKNKIAFPDESIRKFVIFNMDNNTTDFKDNINIHKYNPYPYNEENQNTIDTVEFVYSAIKDGAASESFKLNITNFNPYVRATENIEELNKRLEKANKIAKGS